MGFTTGLSIEISKTLDTIQLDAIIRESNSSNIRLTQFPVESGATITDHAIIEPKKYQLIGSIANMRSIGSASPTSGFFGNDARTTYEELVQLQQQRTTFTVVAGLITYENLLIESISANQDKDTFNSLLFSATLVEILVAETESVNLPKKKVNDGVKNRASSTVDEGRKQPQEA